MVYIWAYGVKMYNYWLMSWSGGGHMQIYSPVWRQKLTISKQAFFRTWLNKWFVYNKEHVLNYENCRMFKCTKTSYMLNDQGKFDSMTPLIPTIAPLVAIKMQHGA